VVEEAPCAILTDDLREKMAQSAIQIARGCDYHGVGTVEFLVDKHLDYYFLEMNTRLQVEHPVTEMITGLDLVELQIRVARGEKLDLLQKDIQIQGHAIECRIYAEDPFHNFLPDIGFLAKHRIPSGMGVRVDSGVEEGAEVPIHYDPMISKLSVHAPTRDKAIEKMRTALSEYEIEGCQTTISFCDYCMQHPSFTQGQYDTHFVSDFFTPDLENDRLSNKHSKSQPDSSVIALMAGVLFEHKVTKKEHKTSTTTSSASPASTPWWTARRAN
jgi:propionyl-CoA carboxylase alpha chain